MRITSGTLRGRKLDFPVNDQIRPTQDKVKQAMFNVLMRVIPGAKVLDLFAGCGALGIEAISRGADNVTFVEHNRTAIASLIKNLNSLKLERVTHVLTHDVDDALSFLENRKKVFDVIILDPPYHKELAKKTLINLSHCDILSPTNVIVAEHAEADIIPDLDNIKLLARKAYGRILLSFYRKI